MKKDYIHREKNDGKHTILFSGSMIDINYTARTSTVGKEFDMVTSYIDYLIEKYEKLKKKRAVIFIEPQLDTGYPDIVIVEYNSTPSLKWNELRNSLNTTDIKILFYIQTHGRCKLHNLRDTLGFPMETIYKTVQKLNNCGLVYMHSKQESVSHVALESYCRINKIISIEAKIDKWNEAIRQARNNIWFSTESYVLMNKGSCSDSIRAACREQGVGIILINGTVKTVLRSNRRKFPVSYASLQFNEWILRYVNRKGEQDDSFST